MRRENHGLRRVCRHPGPLVDFLRTAQRQLYPRGAEAALVRKQIFGKDSQIQPALIKLSQMWLNRKVLASAHESTCFICFASFNWGWQPRTLVRADLRRWRMAPTDVGGYRVPSENRSFSICVHPGESVVKITFLLLLCRQTTIANCSSPRRRCCLRGRPRRWAAESFRA